MLKNSKFAIHLSVFLAGFSYLIFEVSFNRLLSVTLGATVTASTIVLMSFMAGFGLGAFILGKQAKKSANTGKLLALIVVATGVFSFISYLIISYLLPEIFFKWTNIFFADTLLYLSCFVLLFIPSFFMGGLVPTASKISTSIFQNIPKGVGRIYAFETLGSTLGALTAGFILIGNLGQNQTVIIAFLLNLLLAALIITQKTFKNVVFNNISNKNLSDETIKSTGNVNPLLTTFLFGFAVMAMQIIWIRIFKTYFTNTSYTFTLITTASILGLSIGSSVYGKKGGKIKNKKIVLVKSVAFFAILLIVGLFVLYKLPELLMYPFKESAENPFFRIILIPLISSALIVIPPSIISGFSFPLICDIYTQQNENISRNVGKIMMFNTIGSFVGPAFAAFIAIPIFGTGKTILFITLLVTVLIIKLSINKIKEYPKFLKIFSFASSILLLFSLIFIKKIEFLPPSVKILKKNIVAYKETVEGTIIVTNVEEKGIYGFSTFINNSAVIGSNYDAVKTVKMIGHLPFYAGLECKNVLIIGFGIGITTSAVASHQEVEKIDCIELVTGLVDYAHFYENFNSNVYTDKRLNVISGDGRKYLQSSSQKYDLISCDPTHPVLGSGSLYTKDYFLQLYEHLTPNGMVTQYLPLHKLRLEDLLGIIKTFNSVFENTYVFLSQYHAILLGKKNNEKIDFSVWQKKVYATKSDPFIYLNPYHIASSVFFDKETIQKFDNNLKINTDNKNYTEFFPFKSFNENNLYNNLMFFMQNRCDIEDVFINIDDKQKLNEYLSGNEKLTESLYFSLKGNHQQAIKSLEEATKINPENVEYPFLLKLYYGIEE